MLYKRCQMYDGSVEIMIPSHLDSVKNYFTTQFNWMSEDKKVIVNFAKGGIDLDEDGMFVRLDEYYRGFCKDVSDFDCLNIAKRIINGRSYGEIRYNSKMMGYQFYNVFMIGCLNGTEIILNLQCMKEYMQEYIHIFENISDSIRIL